MKPTEYYNYPRRRRPLWWLPLALILPLVLGGTILRSCRGDDTETRLASAAETEQLGAVERNYHTVLSGGALYKVLDRDYAGEYSLTRLLFSPEPGAAAPAGCLLIPRALPSDFVRQEILDRQSCEAFFAALGLSPALPAHSGKYALLTGAEQGRDRAELRLGDFVVSGSSATLLYRVRFPGSGDAAAAWILVLPVPETVTELRVEDLYLPEDLEP